MISFKKKLQKQVDIKLPFVVYRKPNEEQIIGFFQTNDDLHLVKDFSEMGFVFCSFDGNQKIIIPDDISEKIVFENLSLEVLLNNNSSNVENQSSKINFEKLVEKGILEINNNQFQKVVLSRTEVVRIDDLDVVNLFLKLITNYQSAFCYCFYHPRVGLWLGATPEQLLQIKNDIFKTVSLAGTQKFEGSIDVIWQGKEIEEQKIVTDFITNNLKNELENIEISKPFTVQAGNLLHLKTTISGNTNIDFNLYKMIKTLHPTPAVCGLPKEIAKKFILENEDYNREFYTGFLGELNQDNKTDLFVNLRCMKISDNLATLFAGCGITKDSNPVKEYIETVNKITTMKTILD